MGPLPLLTVSLPDGISDVLCLWQQNLRQFGPPFKFYGTVVTFGRKGVRLHEVTSGTLFGHEKRPPTHCSECYIGIPWIVGWNNLNKPNRYNFRTSFLINHVHGSFIYVTSSWSLVIVLGTVPKFDPWCSATQVNAIFESHMLLVKGSGAVLPP